MKFDKSKCFMELDATTERWEHDARILMLGKLNFLVANWPAKPAGKIQFVARECNYTWELGGNGREAYFQPNDPV